jgi:hypothetical protein
MQVAYWNKSHVGGLGSARTWIAVNKLIREKNENGRSGDKKFH